jgi:hypothetical protein
MYKRKLLEHIFRLFFPIESMISHALVLFVCVYVYVSVHTYEYMYVLGEALKAHFQTIFSHRKHETSYVSLVCVCVCVCFLVFFLVHTYECMYVLGEALKAHFQTNFSETDFSCM